MADPAKLHAALEAEIDEMLTKHQFLAALGTGAFRSNAEATGRCLQSCKEVIDLHRTDRARIAELEREVSVRERALELACDDVQVDAGPPSAHDAHCMDYQPQYGADKTRYIAAASAALSKEAKTDG